MVSLYFQPWLRICDLYLGVLWGGTLEYGCPLKGHWLWSLSGMAFDLLEKVRKIGEKRGCKFLGEVKTNVLVMSDPPPDR